MLKHCLTFAVFLMPFISNSQSWRNTGPKGVTACNVQCLASDPSDYNILYAGTSEEGILKSIDGAENWFRINKGIDEYNIMALAVNPRNTSIIFAGNNKGAIYKSTNGGAEWIKVPYDFRPPYNPVSEIVFTPQRPDTIYVAFKGQGIRPGGLFQTIDGGESWSEISDRFQNKNVCAVAVDPKNPSLVYAGSKFYYSPNTRGMFYNSNKSGSSWSGRELPGSPSITDICIDPNNSYTIFVGTDDDGVLKSINRSNNWAVMKSDIWSFSQCEHMNIVINPGNSDTMYTAVKPPNSGEPAVFKSNDGGENWFGSSAGIEGEYLNQIMINYKRPEKLYLASENGFFKTENSGGEWIKSINGLSFIHVNKILINPYDTDTWWIKTNQGVFKTSDKADNWNYFSKYLFPCVYHPQEQILYGLIGEGSYSDAVFKSVNGYSWYQLTYLIGGMAIAIDYYNPDIMYIPTSRGIFKSTDGGYNWSDISTGLTEKSINDLIIDFNHTQKLYAISSKNVWKSDNAGESWENFGGPFSEGGYNPVTLDINPKNPSIIYVSTNEGLYKNFTGDSNWQFIDIPEGEITSFVINPSDTSVLYAGYNSIGVFTSNNSGRDWKEMNSGLSNKRIKSLAVDPVNSSFLAAGSRSDGLYIYDLSTNDVKYKVADQYKSLYSFSTYPNPFNSTLNVEYFLHKRTHVFISIYDILGRKIKTLIDTEKQKGRYSIRYSSDGLSSGIYFIKMRTDDKSITRRLLLIK